MDKVKLKLTGFEITELVEFLDKIELPAAYNGIIVKDITVYALIQKELQEILKDKISGREKELYKDFSVKIPESTALTFFCTWSGSFIGETTFLKVAIKSFCTQVEEQLFMSGRFKMPTDPNNNPLITLSEYNQ